MHHYPKKDISYFAKTNFRSDGLIFGLQQSATRFHTAIFGKTGTGKSNTIRNFCYQDAIQNRGFCVFDIHNDLIPNILEFLPQHRKKDVVYLDIPNDSLQYRYNPLKRVSYSKRSLVASGILESFKTIYRASWGNRLEYVLRLVFLTLLDQKNSTFADIPKLLNDSSFRNHCLKNVVSDDVKSFWQHEFPRYSKTDLTSVLNKVMSFLAHPSIKKVLVENPIDISFRSIMDSNKILLINVNKGQLGNEVSHMISSLLITSIMNAGFSRSTIPELQRKIFHIYLDEFQNYTNKGIINLLSEIRKYAITLTMATQYITALDTDIRNALLGNVGNIIIFRVSHSCAKYFEKEMYPIFKADDFISLANHDIYLRMIINNRVCRPFSATTIKYFDHF